MCGLGFRALIVYDCCYQACAIKLVLLGLFCPSFSAKAILSIVQHQCLEMSTAAMDSAEWRLGVVAGESSLHCV